MNLDEYEKVKDLSYSEYCDYLQTKYGIGKGYFLTKSFNKNPKITRTSEGLFAHHKMEDRAIMLSNKAFAKLNPYEWQAPENIIYCDYLEHLFLHILICENPSPNRKKNEVVGIGGVINFIVPELNDFYSGRESKTTWKINCLNKIRYDKDVYLTLLKRFKYNCSKYPLYTKDCLYTSMGDLYGGWKKRKNRKLFKEIKKI